MRVWTLPCALLCTSVIATAGLGLMPRPARPVVAIYPPWWTNRQGAAAAVAAGGMLVGFGRWSGTVVAASPSPLFGGRLRAGGAWLLLDARALAGCMGSPGSGSDR